MGAGWLLAAPGTLALPHLHPHVIALTHVWLLGALATICFGAVYQLLPVLANTAFTGRLAAWVHLGVHLVGTTIMVVAFRTGELGIVAAGGTLVATGVGLFALNVARTLRAANRLDPILIAFGCSAAWLVVTVIAGVLLAANLRFGWWPMNVLGLLRAHAHLGVVGFFVTLLQGAMFRLVPMFTLATVDTTHRIGWALALSQTGLLVLATSLAWAAAAGTFAGATLLLVSFALSGRELQRIYATRRKRVIEPGLRGFFAGLSLLMVAGLAGAALACGVGDLQAALGYGVLAILGGLLASVQGMLCKIVPFLVWMRVYGPRVGRQVTPQAGTLGRANLERLWVWLHVSGALLLAVGAGVAHVGVLALGATLFAAGQIALLVSLGTTARHVWRPVTAPVAPAAAQPVKTFV
ncbi:hypothetical protein Oter_0901 [Opitutus terrae PB90-1]|uniref:Uncharacterized protein n=2 Tax=Opitutus terrae TaxID=107709 RepID=B1ZWR2_OPITP|nr:hypothetical protein Oter_0901 [Opitutus terrae PB90-1]